MFHIVRIVRVFADGSMGPVGPRWVGLLLVVMRWHSGTKMVLYMSHRFIVSASPLTMR